MYNNIYKNLPKHKLELYKQEQGLQITKSYISNKNYIPTVIQATIKINENYSQPDYASPQNKKDMQLSYYFTHLSNES